MMKRLGLLTALVLLASSSLAFAQGGTTAALSGLVVDTDGGVIPGATVVVKNNATSVNSTTVTNSTGAFSLPALAPGAYTVTVSLSGFKTKVITDTVLVAATPASIRVVLEIGQMSETVEVKGGADIVQTQSSSLATTLNVDQIAKLPATTRNALNFLTFLPGVETSGVNRDSEVMGLPQSTIAISIDGVNVQDNYLKSSDGFFARVTPRQDAVEQVTMSSATPGADAAGQGAVQIQFVTRSGTNTYKGTVYHFYRDAALNSISWFNERNGLGKDQVTLHQFGGSEGGPIVIPGIINGRGKAFFFVNHEELRLPTEVAKTRTILNSSSQQGIFTLQNGTQYNLFAIANDQLAAGVPRLPIDPTIASALAIVNKATEQTGLIRRDANQFTVLSYVFQSPAHQRERQPTTRVDVNLSNKHRLTGTYNWEVVIRDPDYLNNAEARFPGLPNARYYASYRPSTTTTLRSTLTGALVNELKFGAAWGPSYFGLGPGAKYEGPDDFVNQGGYSLGFPLGATSMTTETGPSARAANNWNLDDKVNWLHGNHNISFGGSFTNVKLWLNTQTLVPSLSFGMVTSDPAANIFNANTMPGATNGELTNAANLYAFLTGRLTAINGTSRIDANTGNYAYNGPGVERGNMNEVGIFVQDAWRVRPTLTINAGLRYEVEYPFSANIGYASATFESLCGVSGVGDGIDGRHCNLAMPGTLTGVKPQYVQYTPNTRGYNVDFNNLAPNIGAAWQPNVESGWLRTLLGDPAQATVRGGYSVAYNRNGLSELRGVFAANPGLSYSSNRNTNNGNLLAPGQTYLTLRDSSLLGPPPTCAGAVTAACVPASPVLPIATTVSQSVNIFDPNLEVSFSRSYTLGFQRSLGKDTAFELRYVGTRNVGGWTNENWNEPVLLQNGFLDEFKLAQQNLLANIANGKGNTFAYTGPGTSPLPIFLAYYNGRNRALAGDPAQYTGSNWTNATVLGYLSMYNPNPTTLGSGASNNGAQGIFNDATKRAAALQAGLPANFFVLNPDASSANIMRSVTFTKYNSVQLELRRRLSRGFQVSGNYTYAQQFGSSLETIFRPRLMVRSANVPHAIKGNWTWELPVGRGKRFGANMNGWLDAALGGWEFDGTARFQRRSLSMSGVRLVGMTVDELQDAYKVQIRVDPTTGLKNVFMFPEDIVTNTRRAFNTSATSATGYSTTLGPPEGRYIAPASMPGCVELYPGDCGEPTRIFLNGPIFGRVDLSVKKTFRLVGKVNAQLQVDVLNAFNSINFNPVLNPSANANTLQVTSAYSDSSNTFDPGGRLGQISWRVNW